MQEPTGQLTQAERLTLPRAGAWSIDTIGDGTHEGADDKVRLPVIVAEGGMVCTVHACANPRRALADEALPDIGDNLGCEGFPVGRNIAFMRARLIAAAPDLYAALAEFHAAEDESSDGWEKADGPTRSKMMDRMRKARNAARAALRRAHGAKP